MVSIPLNEIQISHIDQNELAKLILIGSGGLLEVSWPMNDDERRDAEVHIRGQFGESIAIQVKCASHLQVRPKHVTPRLLLWFHVRQEHLVSDPRLFYHFAWLRLEEDGRFADPQFFPNSIKVHQHAAPKLVNGEWRFSFTASLAENSRDMWVPDRVHGSEVGRLILQILEDHAKLPRAQRPSQPFRLPPGAAFVRRKR